MVTKYSEHRAASNVIVMLLFSCKPLQLTMSTHDPEVPRYRRDKDETNNKPQDTKMLYYTPTVSSKSSRGNVDLFFLRENINLCLII